MFWLSPANEGSDPFAPLLRHWKVEPQSVLRRSPAFNSLTLGGLSPRCLWTPWMVMTSMPLMGNFPREKWELKAQSMDRTGARLLREQTLQARASNKSSAQMAAGIAQVHLLTSLIADQAALLFDLACARQGNLDNVKLRTLQSIYFTWRQGVDPLLAGITPPQWSPMGPAGTLLAPPLVQ